MLLPPGPILHSGTDPLDKDTDTDGSNDSVEQDSPEDDKEAFLAQQARLGVTNLGDQEADFSTSDHGETEEGGRLPGGSRGGRWPLDGRREGEGGPDGRGGRGSRTNGG